MFRNFLALVALGLFALSSGLSEAQASPRSYDPTRDGPDTLRICFKVQSITATAIGFEAELRYTGGEKLDRKKSYPSVGDTEKKTIGSMDPNNPIVYAEATDQFLCEIVWEMGSYWVVSREEVSGDR